MSCNLVVFQEDSSPAYRERDAIELSRREISEFISADKQPMSSLDLDPVDYQVWATKQQDVY